MGVGVVESHEVYELQLSSAISKVKWSTRRPHSLKISQCIAKSMAYIINQLCGDFQQAGCLYGPNSVIQWAPEHSWTSDRPQKQASEKADPSTLILAVVY